jgi:hypothetical protein
MEEYGQYRITLDKDWSLEDLYEFPRAYEQVYFFYASLDHDLEEPDRDSLVRTYQSFPWQGGYSAVSFFKQLKYAIPPGKRPRILSIQKASPGWLDLGLWLGTAYSVSKAVKYIACALDTANTTYNNIYKGMQERKLLKLKVEQSTLDFNMSELEFIEDSCETLAKLLELSSATEINDLTKNRYLSLKVLLSVYRRVRTLVQYKNNGKAELTEEDIPPQFPLTPPTKRGSEKGTPRKRRQENSS